MCAIGQFDNVSCFDFRRVERERFEVLLHFDDLLILVEVEHINRKEHEQHVQWHVRVLVERKYEYFLWRKHQTKSL